MLRDDVEALESPIKRGFAVYDQAAMIKLCRAWIGILPRVMRSWVVFSISRRFARETAQAGGRCIAEKPPVGLGWDKSEIKPARVQSAISSLKTRASTHRRMPK